MTIAATTTPTYFNWIADCIHEGYVWECPCGEHYRSMLDAAHCRKCRVYAPLFAGEWVHNIKTGEALGQMPTPNEMTIRLEEQAKLIEANRIAEEKRREEEAFWTHFFRWEDKAEALGF